MYLSPAAAQPSKSTKFVRPVFEGDDIDRVARPYLSPTHALTTVLSPTLHHFPEANSFLAGR
tara:strand:+ start:781 stop:966 length:186 start_codon:yes stop_codon:yes gene_type:complete